MNPIKRLFTIIGELMGGIFHPNNPLVFAKSLFFWVIIATLIAIPAFAMFVANSTIKLNNQKINVVQIPDILLAEVASRKIYKSDVAKLINETYEDQAITQDLIKTFLNIAIERKVLDRQAIESNIVVSDQEVQNRIREEGLEATDPVIKDKIFYNLLKEKVLQQQIINSRTANVVEYWSPSITDPEIATDVSNELYKAQREQGKQALDLIRQKLSEIPDILDATRAVLAENSFPELSEIIAVNGYKLAKVSDEKQLRTSYTYTSKDQEVLGIEFYEALFGMKNGEIRTVFREENSAGKLFQVINSSQGNYNTYDQWLADKKQSFVKIKVNL